MTGRVWGPRVSVILPLYNKEPYIGRALDSIPAHWRLPWFLVGLPGCTPLAKWAGAAARLAGWNLRQSHAQ